MFFAIIVCISNVVGAKNKYVNAKEIYLTYRNTRADNRNTYTKLYLIFEFFNMFASTYSVFETNSVFSIMSVFSNSEF